MHPSFCRFNRSISILPCVSLGICVCVCVCVCVCLCVCVCVCVCVCSALRQHWRYGSSFGQSILSAPPRCGVGVFVSAGYGGSTDARSSRRSGSSCVSSTCSFSLFSPCGRRQCIPYRSRCVCVYFMFMFVSACVYVCAREHVNCVSFACYFCLSMS